VPGVEPWIVQSVLQSVLLLLPTRTMWITCTASAVVTKVNRITFTTNDSNSSVNHVAAVREQMLRNIYGGSNENLKKCKEKMKP